MNKPEYFVDKVKCIKCGNCNYICSGFCSKTDAEGFPYIDKAVEQFCFTCGQCVSVCPTGALEHSNIDLKQCDYIDPDVCVSKEQVAHLIKTRRSIRHFKNESISRESLNELFDVVRFAPTGGNYQGVRYIVVDDNKTIQKLSRLTSEYLKEFVKKPGNEWLLLPACAEKTDDDWVFWNAPVVIIATADNPTDLTIALSYLDLYAQSSGYGCCWCGYLNFAMDGEQPDILELFKQAGLKEYYYPMIIGIPEERIHFYRVPERKKADIRYVNP